MIHYFDTSAYIKLLIKEEESLRVAQSLEALRLAGDQIVSSSLLITELHRGAKRAQIDPEVVRHYLSMIDLIRCSDEILHVAASLEDPVLRSLDAIHIATALEIQADSFTTFDHRQANAAQVLGLSSQSTST